MKKHGSFYVITYTVVVAALFGLALAGVSQMTKERITSNMNAKKKSQILTALGIEIAETASSKEIEQQFDDFVAGPSVEEDPATTGEYRIWEG